MAQWWETSLAEQTAVLTAASKAVSSAPKSVDWTVASSAARSVLQMAAKLEH